MARPRVESSWPSPASWACRFALSAPASKSAISFLLTRRPTSIPSSTKAVDRYDIPFMQRALDLARKGTGLASPNPMVGAIVVGNGEVLGEGFHRYESRDHAEIVALKSAGERARGATLYVSLEPCCHAGRTGPCTDAIVAAGIARVVAAMKDPNPKVAGRGIERLRAAGIEAETGVLEEEARRVNEAFAFWVHAGKPFVTLKSALTLDGQLALPGSRKPSGNQDDARWITSPESRAEVQRMRHASDALLTGIGTILADDPLLTDRRSARGRRRAKPVSVLCSQSGGRGRGAVHASKEARLAATRKRSISSLRPRFRRRRISARCLPESLSRWAKLNRRICQRRAAA